MRQFTTDSAARDYNRVITAVNAAAIRKPQEIWLNGYSYGTMLVNRIVYMFPNLATHVLIDGIMFGPDARTIFTDYDLSGDFVFNQIFSACVEDAFCKTKIQSASFGVDTMKKVSGGSCKHITDNIEMDKFRVMLRYIGVQNVVVREMLPMLMYRMNRCDDKIDGTFLAYFAQSMARSYDAIAVTNPSAYSAQRTRNLILGVYIQINENCDVTTPVAQLLARFDNSPLGPGLSVSSYRSNIYPAMSGRYMDPLGGVVSGNNATTVKAVMFVSGGWDSQTPARIGAARWNDSFLSVPNRFEFVAPRRAHINSLPGLPHPCGSAVAKEFITKGGSVSAAEEYFRTSSDCTGTPWFDWNATLLTRTTLGQALGVIGISSDIWEARSGPADDSNTTMYIVIGVVGGVVFLAVVIIIIIVVVMKRNKANKISASVVVGRDDNPYNQLNDSLLPK